MARTDPVFNLRMSTELKEKISALAKKNKRSINAEIVAAVEAAIEEEEIVNSGIDGDGKIKVVMPDAWTMDVYNELLDKGFFDIISRKSLEQANKKKP
ncbi:TPA: Arc family DNA-binding protein [Yersinia enterocolitica]